MLKPEIIGKSVEGRNLYVVKISKSEFGNDTSKIKVLIFAQQHGDEQSGKEGALLLLKEIAEGKLNYLFDKIDFLLVPQVNPDGSEKDTRRNANNADLNRNHLILTQPETIALYKLFNKYLPEVNMDVHEYYPYGESWQKYGYYPNSDEEIGTITNINASQKIRNLSDNEYLNFIKKFLNDRGFSYSEYCPGGPPGIDYIRPSTFDINDGRQCPGIQNTFSFIQEGLNGKDSLDNIKHRAEGQMTGMLGLLEFTYENKDRLKNFVKEEREKLILGNVSNKVSIQLDHFPDGRKLDLHLVSFSSGKDTIVTVQDFRPLVKSLYDVIRPAGYLIPKNLSDIYNWAKKHSITITNYKKTEGDKIEQYYVSGLDSMDFEGDTIVNPEVEVRKLTNNISENDYFYIPTNQLKNNLIVIALEPKSELGLSRYPGFSYLIKEKSEYPILRVVRK